MAGESLLIGHCGSSPKTVGVFGANAAFFQNLCQTVLNDQASGTVAEAALQQKIRGACTVSRLGIFVTANARTSDTIIKSRKNGSDGNLTITIPAGGTGWFEDTTHTDSLADGDLYCFSINTGSGNFDAFTFRYMRALMVMSSGHAAVYLGRGPGDANVSTSAAYVSSSTSVSYWALCGITNSGMQTTDSDNETRMPLACPGVLSHLQVYVPTNARTSDVTVTLRVNGSDTAVTLTIPAGQTGLFEDTSHSAAVANMDRCGYKVDPGAGTGSITLSRVTAKFLGDVDAAPYASRANDSAVSGTRYSPMVGDSRSSGTEATFATKIPFSGEVSNVWARGSTWAAASHSVYARKNAADTAVVASLTGAGAGATATDTTHTEAFSDGDELDFKWVVGGASNAAGAGFRLGATTPPPVVIPVRATQIQQEALYNEKPPVRSSQMHQEAVFSETTLPVRMTQAWQEAVYSEKPPVRMSQAFVEVLYTKIPKHYSAVQVQQAYDPTLDPDD
jgi:hypothetical protein